MKDNVMSTDYKTWIYSKTEEPKVILFSEFDKYKEDGWADSPAAFLDLTIMDINVDNQAEVQSLGEMTVFMGDMHNWILNIDTKTVKEIKAFALEHFDFKMMTQKKNKMKASLLKYMNTFNIELED